MIREFLNKFVTDVMELIPELPRYKTGDFVRVKTGSLDKFSTSKDKLFEVVHFDRSNFIVSLVLPDNKLSKTFPINLENIDSFELVDSATVKDYKEHKAFKDR